MNTTVISHIALHVQHLEKSTNFYQDVIGLPSIPEPFKIGKHSWFAIGSNCQLHLIAGAGAGMIHDINNHISFSTNQFDSFIHKLRAQGIMFFNALKQENVVENRPDGVLQVFFQDPDGYWLEMNNEFKD
jgi:lactoylglutathione lyase